MISKQMGCEGTQKITAHEHRCSFYGGTVKPIKKKTAAERAKIKARRKQNRH